MATGQLTTTGPDERHAGLEIERACELVELSERLYHGVFTAGLLLAAVTTGYGLLLSLLQPTGDRLVAVVVCLGLLIALAITGRYRQSAYRRLRRAPWLVVVAALVFAAAVTAIGPHNEQMFYVLVIVFGVLSVATPLAWVAVAALIAASGLALPRILDGDWTIADAIVAAVALIVFWLIIEQLARFILRLHHALQTEPNPSPPPVRVHAWTEPDAQQQAPTDDQLPATPLPQARLTARQLQIVALRCEGLDHAEIAACLSIGPQQVRRHLRTARQRVGAQTTPQLIAWAIASGLVPTPTT